MAKVSLPLRERFDWDAVPVGALAVYRPPEPILVLRNASGYEVAPDGDLFVHSHGHVALQMYAGQWNAIGTVVEEANGQRHVVYERFASWWLAS